MKKYLIVLIFLILNGIVFSQKNVTVKWGPTYKYDNMLIVKKIVAVDNSGFYTLSIRLFKAFKNKKIFLNKYDKNMKLVYSKELLIPKYNNKSLNFEDVLYLKNQLILFVSFYNNKENKNYAFAYPISKEGVVGSKLKKLDEFTSNIISNKRRGNFDFVMSKDSTKLLVYRNEDFKKYKNEKFSYKVYDNTLNLLWEKDVQLPYKDKYFIVKDYKITNDGKVYMRAEILPDKEEKKELDKDEQPSTFIILSYDLNKDKLSQYEIKLNNKWVQSMSYNINENTKEITVGGFYSNDKKLMINGVFYLTIDPESGNINVKSQKEFDKDFMVEMIGERRIEKGKGLANYYKLKNFLTKNDGGAYLIAEQDIVTTSEIKSANGSVYKKTYYHYNNILVVSVDKSGQISWIRNIPKFSSDTEGGYYLSYAHNFNKKTNELNFIFNDNPKNLEPNPKTPRKIYSLGALNRSVVALVNLNNEGYMQRMLLFNNNEIGDVYLRPKINLQVSDNELIVYAIKGKTYSFGKITFK
jgi:hypothetical protein